MGLFVIISSPTGGGKDAAINNLLKIFHGSVRLVTTTTRAPRPSDKEDTAYNFISREEFENKIKEGYFLEHNNCVGNYYGTPKEKLKNLLEKHRLVLTNLDVNGKKAMDKAGVEHLSVFLLPENIDTLKKRVSKRGGMTKEMINDRIALAQKEVKQAEIYDFKIINYEGKLDETIKKIAEIIQDALANRQPVDKK
ncbi:MAG: hypothetical protein AAB348_00240 [Patescibacteria group bacterium]